jgi:hypothetical protein
VALLFPLLPYVVLHQTVLLHSLLDEAGSILLISLAVACSVHNVGGLMDWQVELLILIITYSVILSVTRAFLFCDVLDPFSLTLLESSLVEECVKINWDLFLFFFSFFRGKLVGSVIHLVLLVGVPYILLIGCNHHYVGRSLKAYRCQVVYFVLLQALPKTLHSAAVLPVFLSSSMVTVVSGGSVSTLYKTSCQASSW